MSQRVEGDECSRGGCSRKGVIKIRDGRIYCKHHGDRLPAYQRREAGKASGGSSRMRTATRRDGIDPNRANRAP